MSSLVNFRENLKDNMTNSLLDYLNYMYETKKNSETNDALAKCVLMCGELFSNQVKRGNKSQEDIESFEANLLSGTIFSDKNEDLDLANTMVREGNAMALAEYESTYGEANNVKGLKKVA